MLNVLLRLRFSPSPTGRRLELEQKFLFLKGIRNSIGLKHVRKKITAICSAKELEIDVFSKSAIDRKGIEHLKRLRQE
jgi:hypothetical protein